MMTMPMTMTITTAFRIRMMHCLSTPVTFSTLTVMELVIGLTHFRSTKTRPVILMGMALAISSIRMTTMTASRMCSTARMCSSLTTQLLLLG